MNEIASPLVQKLEQWRVELQMTHRQFAGHLGIDESYWSQLRHGKREGRLKAEKLIERVRQDRPELLYFLVSAA